MGSPGTRRRARPMKDRRAKGVKRGSGRVRRRNPVARALIAAAKGSRTIKSRRTYSRKAKHPRPEGTEDG